MYLLTVTLYKRGLYGFSWCLEIGHEKRLENCEMKVTSQCNVGDKRPLG